MVSQETRVIIPTLKISLLSSGNGIHAWYLVLPVTHTPADARCGKMVSLKLCLEASRGPVATAVCMVLGRSPTGEIPPFLPAVTGEPRVAATPPAHSRRLAWLSPIPRLDRFRRQSVAAAVLHNTHGLGGSRATFAAAEMLREGASSGLAVAPSHRPEPALCCHLHLSIIS